MNTNRGRMNGDNMFDEDEVQHELFEQEDRELKD